MILSIPQVDSSHYVISSYHDQTPRSIRIDSSPNLSELEHKAEQLRELPFAEKLAKIEELVLSAIKNYVEHWNTQLPKASYKEPLSCSLKYGVGNSEAQAILFLVLSAIARLGTLHHLQSSGIGFQLYFNDVTDDLGNVHHVDIWSKSFSDPSKNQLAQYTDFTQPHRADHNKKFLAYTINESGCTLYASKGCHFDALPRALEVIERFPAIDEARTKQSFAEALKPENIEAFSRLARENQESQSILHKFTQDATAILAVPGSSSS